MTSERYMSLREIAEQVGWSRETIRKMANRNCFPAYRPIPGGRKKYLLSEVQSAIRAKRVDPSEEAKRRAEEAARKVMRERAGECR